MSDRPSPSRESAVQPEASAEVLQARLDTLREVVRERPDASIYVNVKGGKARLVMPGGEVVFVREGEAIRVWPHYYVREEHDA